MLHDYLTFGYANSQTEIANFDRVMSYAPRVTGSRWNNQTARNQVLWPAMAAGINGGPYTDPAADGAPWYQAGVAESEGFAGFFVKNILGGGGATLSRPVYRGSSGGASFGPGRLNGRSRTFQGLLVGAGELQLDYGFEWMSQILLGKCVPPGVDTSMRWFSGRPQHRGVDCGLPDLAAGAVGNEFAFVREAYHVRLTGAPTVVRSWGTQGCLQFYEVEFEMTFGSPYVFGGCANIEVGLDITTDRTAVVLPCCDDVSGFTPPCWADPFDPSDLTVGNCWCQPTIVSRHAVQIDPIGDRRFVPTIAIENGPAEPSRNMRIAFYERRPGDAAYDTGNPAVYNDLYECQRKVGVIEVPYLPEDATLHADGRVGRVWIELADGTVVNRQVAQGEGGAPMIVPSSDGCSSMVVVIETDAHRVGIDGLALPNGTAAGTTATIQRCDQYVTAGGI